MGLRCDKQGVEMRAGRTETLLIVERVRQMPPVEYDLAPNQGEPWLWANGKPVIRLLTAMLDLMIDDDGSRWLVIDTEYQRRYEAHYAVLPEDPWAQRLRDAGVEVDV